MSVSRQAVTVHSKCDCSFLLGSLHTNGCVKVQHCLLKLIVGLLPIKRPFLVHRKLGLNILRELTLKSTSRIFTEAISAIDAPIQRELKKISDVTSSHLHQGKNTTCACKKRGKIPKRGINASSNDFTCDCTTLKAVL